MYITQQLRNNKDRRRSEKRVSSILIKQKIYSDTLDTIMEIQKEDHDYDSDSPKKSHLFPLKRYHSEAIDIPPLAPVLPRQKTPENFRIRKKHKEKNKGRKNRAGFCQQLKRSSKMFMDSEKKENKNGGKNVKLKPLNHEIFLENWVSEREEGIDLQDENINKLKSFIRGAYFTEYQQYSDFVNLRMVERDREDFYIFKNLYQKTADENIMNKLSIKDAKSQSLRDVVCLNEHKDQVTAPELKKIMKTLKIVQ